MQDTTPTAFRSNLFKFLEQALQGLRIRIRTKHGNLLIIPEAKNKTGNSAKDFSKPKVKGRILGDLCQADQELRDYIKIPK